MKALLTLLLLCGCSCVLVAQKEANIWYFGYSVGLDFGLNCQPTNLTNSRMSSQEGCAVMSNGKTGQILFYSDAFNVWNRTHQKMPNSGDGDIREGVERDYSALSQGALIVPMPGDSAKYYLFSLIETDRRSAVSKQVGRLTYSLVDLRLDDGLGDLTLNEKNKPLSNELVGRLTAIPHRNGRDYWVLTHQWNSNAFLVYPLTPTGLGKADTIRIGSVIKEAYGILKASPDGRKLACSSRGVSAQPFDLYDFDPATGAITNHVNLGNLRVAYGISFSPDNTKLYISTMTTAAVKGSDYFHEHIRQYDVAATSPAAVAASGKSIIYGNQSTNIQQDKRRFNDFYAPTLHIGPDGKIYCASNANAGECDGCGRRFFVINKPNERGFGCDVQVQTAELGTGLVGNASDFPNFMQHYFNGLEPKDCPFDRSDECTVANVQVFPNPARDVIEILVTDLCFTPYSLRIINAAGQVLALHEVTTPRSQILNIATLPGGIYFAELQFTNRTTVKRFVKY